MRKRYVYPTVEIPHLWAHQTQGEARNPQSNLYFEGPVIFSYRTTFPLGRLVERKGQTVALLTSHSHSNTTGRHKTLTSRAVSHLQSFTVPELGEDVWTASFKRQVLKVDHKANFKFFKEKIEDLAKKEIRARGGAKWHYRNAISTIREANAYCGFFGLRTRFQYPAEEALKRTIRNERRTATEENAEFRVTQKERAIKRAASEKRAVATWLSSNAPAWQLDLPRSPVYLRTFGNDVQTSLGARVPISHAKAIIAKVRLIKAGTEATYQHNGHSIHAGDFRVDSITADGTLTAGCHVIKFDQLEALAINLGFEPFKVYIAAVGQGGLR